MIAETKRTKCKGCNFKHMSVRRGSSIATKAKKPRTEVIHPADASLNFQDNDELGPTFHICIERIGVAI